MNLTMEGQSTLLGMTDAAPIASAYEIVVEIYRTFQSDAQQPDTEK